MHTRGEAWIDLLYLADKDNEVRMSLRELAGQWGWNPKTVIAFLAQLEMLRRIERTGKNGKGSVYCIIQDPKPAPKTKAKAKKKPRPVTSEFDVEFDALWPAWKGHPNNNRKAGLEKYIATRRRGVSFGLLKKKTIAYYKYCEAEGILGTNRMMMTSTFFGPHERWNASFEVTEPTPKTKDGDVPTGFGDDEFFTGEYKGGNE